MFRKMQLLFALSVALGIGVASAQEADRHETLNNAAEAAVVTPTERRTRSPNQASTLTFEAIATPAPESDHWDFPFKAEDMRDDERIYLACRYHACGDTPPPGVQKFGYDLGLVRFIPDSGNPKAGQWTGTKDIGDERAIANEDYYINGLPVYAMRDGKVIACWRNAPESYKPGVGAGSFHEELTKYEGKKSRIYGGGNHLWVAHDDGSRVEYAHFQPGTVPESLCPNKNDALLPVVINSPRVGDAWPHIRVATSDQRMVRKGQRIGLVGMSGTGSSPHLHIHREEGGRADTQKQGGTAVELKFRNGLYRKLDNDWPYGTWESFAGQVIPPTRTVVWPPRGQDREYAGHGHDVEKFGAVFHHLADSGYAPGWLDFYTVGGKAFINHVWRPAERQWRAYFGVNASQYQSIFDTNTGAEFYPTFIESYTQGDVTRFAGVFEYRKSGQYMVQHGVNYRKHVAQMSAAAEAGLSPVNVAVSVATGQRQYTSLYRKQNISAWEIKSAVNESRYQTEYNRQTAQGRKPVALNAYMFEGTPYISAVFADLQTNGRVDRHGLSGTQYQNAYESALQSGALTRTVTAFDNARSQHRFAASWWK